MVNSCFCHDIAILITLTRATLFVKASIRHRTSFSIRNNVSRQGVVTRNERVCVCLYVAVCMRAFGKLLTYLQNDTSCHGQMGRENDN